MFVTVDEVQDITSFEVDEAMVQLGQFIIEAYVGKREAEVFDSGDLYLLRLATAYQAAYIKKNTSTVFEQVGIREVTQDRFRMVMRSETDPYLSPLAKMACQRLSWFSSKSISTAPVFHAQSRKNWRAD